MVYFTLVRKGEKRKDYRSGKRGSFEQGHNCSTLDSLTMNISKSALNSLITHLQRVVERAKAEPKDCRTQDALRLLRAKDLPYLKRRLKSE